MAGNAENPKIGLDNVVIAKLIADDGASVPVYDTPIPLRGAVTASVNPNSSVETDYADNSAFFVTGNRANTEMSLELTNVAPATLALMLGQTRVNGITQEKPLDQAPYFALGFRVWIGGTDENGDKIFEYFWYSKGKFSVPETGGNTKGDSIEFQHVSLTAQFVPTQYSPDGNGGVICSHARSDIDTPAATITAWFNAPVIVPSGDFSKLTVTAAQATASIEITATKESGSTPDIAESSVKLGESVLVADASDGTAIPGSVVVEGDTITFTPTTAFEAADVVLVSVTAGVQDTSGVHCEPYAKTITIA